MTSKEEFFEVANSLDDAYPDFARCLYSEALYEGIIDHIYSYMKNNPTCSTDEVLFYLDNLLDNPRPLVGIVSEKQAKQVAALV